MSTRMEAHIHCDVAGCGEVFRCGVSGAWATRDVAKRIGWTYVVPEGGKRVGPVKSFDFCPAHSKEARDGSQ